MLVYLSFFLFFSFFLSFFFSSFLGGGVEVGGGETLVERLISIHHGNYSTIFCFRADPLSSSRTFDPERVNVAPHSAFWISTEVVTALVSCYTAGATWKCWNFYARSVYTALHNHFIRSHMCTVHARLAVTWSLHLFIFWGAEWSGSFTCYCNETAV